MLSSNYLVKCRLRDRGWHRLIQKAIAAIGLAPRIFARNHELMLTHAGRKCLIPKSLTRTACGPVASLVSVKLHAAVTLMLELVPLPDPGNERDRVLTPDEWNRLYGAAPDHLKPILVIAFQLGMRWGEIMSLTWNCVDIQRSFLRVFYNTCDGLQTPNVF